MSDNHTRKQFYALLTYPLQPSENGLNRDTAATNFRSYAATMSEDATPLPDLERDVIVGNLGVDVPMGTTVGQAVRVVNRHFDVWWNWHEQVRGGN